MSNYETFQRFRNILTQATVAYHAGETISWDVQSSGMSPSYIRTQLRTVMKSYLMSPRWHESDIPASTIQSILANWAIRDTLDGHVEIGPRKHPTRFGYTDPISPPLAPPVTTDSGLSIDGTNPAFVHAICLLKNHDQISNSILLTNFDTTLLDSLYATYPNIELIPDTIAGVQTPNYILI